MAMGSQQLIANELLAFIQNAIDTMDEVSIVQICKSNFKEDEVCSGKALLFRSLGKTEQMPSRRRDGGEKSLQDIITVLKETDPDDVPTFVAKELHKLPPVTFDHVDVTRLLKDIIFLKTSLAEVQCKLEASENIIVDLRAQVVLLSNTASVCRSPEVSNVNTRRGAQNASIGSFESAHMDASPAAAVTERPRPAAPSAAPPPETSRVRTSTPERAYAAVTASRPPAAASTQPQAERLSTKGKKHTRVPAPVAVPSEPQRREEQCDKDGFKTVVRRKKPTGRNFCGTAPTGPNHLLRPAVPTTLLYVSRLHYSTKPDDIVEYMRIKTKFTLRVVRLESRRNVNFNSFVVRVPTEHLATFTKEEFWPKGVMYRRYRGTLPDTRVASHVAAVPTCKRA